MYGQLLVVLAAVLAPAVHGSCVHNTSLRPRAADGAVPISNFGYTGAQGPLNWAGLAPENAACATSKEQSPININTATASRLQEVPQLDFAALKSAEFENLGSTIEVVMPAGNATTTLDGTRFGLAQFHLHTPSEHRIDDEYFPLEMHMVHESEQPGQIAVIAVLFQLSANDTTGLMTAVTRNLADIAKPGTKTETGPLDFSQLVAHIRASPLLTYRGSLTTPPCSDGLTFVVVQKPLPLDVDTFNRIKATVKFNARYTQNVPGQDNLLDLGCRSADSARLGAPAGGGVGNGTAITSTTAVPSASSPAASGGEAERPSASGDVTAVTSIAATPSASSSVAAGGAAKESSAGGDVRQVTGARHGRVPRARRWVAL